MMVQVQVRVVPGMESAFIEATRANASASVLEPGIARFDVVRHRDDPTRFILIEVYRDADAPLRHKETEHYALWRDTVAPMMAEPRTSVKLDTIFPEPADW